ncbi:unnamed protein product [Pieris macdunnoughi]|uniref:RdRp catalytic domain-containing protein n=1 Tax=Pieris macdunnoughi TaxID=345717 RepID=A0A821XPL1_9NEOP|nr:unnamed protein product [Pieris macdunnoughi]
MGNKRKKYSCSRNSKSAANARQSKRRKINEEKNQRTHESPDNNDSCVDSKNNNRDNELFDALISDLEKIDEKKQNIHLEETANIEEFELEVEPQKHIIPPYQIIGRRIVDFMYFFDQIKIVANHNPGLGCSISNVEIVKEILNGLESTIHFKCTMCNKKFNVTLCNNNFPKEMTTNHAAVTGAMLIGCGWSNLNEFLSAIDLPNLGQKSYATCHNDVSKWWAVAAEASMKEAAEEEAKLAIEGGEVITGIPSITVVADACWSKRSYKSSSSSMEQASIVEGFKNSVEKRNLIYSTLIADGDASTYKKILESRPYANVQVQKIECSNHLLRNYCSKLMQLQKDTSIPLTERKLLTSERITRLRTAVRAAARFRNAQTTSNSEKNLKLRDDIINSPKHVFGDHSACENYYCPEDKKKEQNLVPVVKNLFGKLIAHVSQIALHSKSLLWNVNNNRAEQFNSIVAKHIGGKRINFSLKNSYTARCHAAVVAFNTGKPQYNLYQTNFKQSPRKAVKILELRRRRRNIHRRRQGPKRKIIFSNENRDYGEKCQKPDLSPEQYDIAKSLFLSNLKELVENRHAVERDTVLQAESALWLELRRCLLTASSFSMICKRRPNISSAPLVKSIVYSYSLDKVPAIEYGKSNAIDQLQQQENIVVEKCGLFIDKEHYFLGASPDGLYNQGIIEIKCPYSARNMDAEEAIRQSKIKFWKLDGTVNTNHDWYYQIQGQLHISEKKLCLFAVWTGQQFPLKVEVISRDEGFLVPKNETEINQFLRKTEIFGVRRRLEEDVVATALLRGLPALAHRVKDYYVAWRGAESAPQPRRSPAIDLDLPFLQSIYDAAYPSHADVLYEHDQLCVDNSDLSLGVDKLSIEPGKSYLKEKKFATMQPVLRTMMPNRRMNSQKEAVLGILKRNLNAPRLAEATNTRHFVGECMAVNFLRSAVDPDKAFLLDEYKDDPIDLNPALVTKWLLTQKPQVAMQAQSDAGLETRAFNTFSYMVKADLKPPLEEAAQHEYASVQTIAYNTKDVNVVFCTIFPEVRDRLLRVYLPKLQILTGMSPSAFVDHLNALVDASRLARCYAVENDMRKYKSQDAAVLMFECSIMRTVGIAEHLVELWYNSHAESRFVDKHNGITDIKFQRRSGDASTFLGNTLFCMAVVLATYDVDDIVLGLFAGDDSLLYMQSRFAASVDNSGKLAALFNLESKLLTGFKHAYFCSKFLLLGEHRLQLIPDPMKTLCKLGRRDLRDEDHVEEYRRSIADNLSALGNAEWYEVLSDAVVERYKLKGLELTKFFSVLHSVLNSPTEFASLYRCPESGRLLKDPSRQVFEKKQTNPQQPLQLYTQGTIE